MAVLLYKENKTANKIILYLLSRIVSSPFKKNNCSHYIGLADGEISDFPRVTLSL